MDKKIIINKKLKRKEDKKKIAGKKWTQDDDYILAVWEKYKQNKISSERLLDIFPGRTFHAIFSKVYNIRGKRRVIHQKNIDPNQLELPLGGTLHETKTDGRRDKKNNR